MSDQKMTVPDAAKALTARLLTPTEPLKPDASTEPDKTDKNRPTEGNRGPGRPRKYQTEEEQEAARKKQLADAQKRRRDKKAVATGGLKKVGRPPKYKTFEERYLARQKYQREYDEKAWLLNETMKIAAYEECYGEEYIPLRFPPEYRDGRGINEAELLGKNRREFTAKYPNGYTLEAALVKYPGGLTEEQRHIKMNPDPKYKEPEPWPWEKKQK